MFPQQPKIGDFSQRLKIMRPSGTRDSIGGYTEVLTEVNEIWADVRPMTKEADTTDGQVNFFEKLRILVRAGHDIQRSDYLRWKGNDYAIEVTRPTGEALLEIYASNVD